MEPARAWRILGLEAGAPRAEVDTAWRIRSTGLDRLIAESTSPEERRRWLAAKNDAVEAYACLIETLATGDEDAPATPPAGTRPGRALRSGIVRCPRRDDTCDHRLHEETGAIACALLCQPWNDAGTPRTTVGADVAHFADLIREAVTDLGSDGMALWFDQLREDLHRILPRGFNSEQEDYFTSRVPETQRLSAPELALRCALVLARVGAREALGALRHLALLSGTWEYESIDDGEYMPKRATSTTDYPRIDACARIYLCECLRHGDLDRLFAEEHGPLADLLQEALTGKGRRGPEGPYYGAGGCARALCELAAEATTAAVVPTPAVRALIEERFVERIAGDGADAGLALAYFAHQPDAAPEDRLRALALAPTDAATKRAALAPLLARAPRDAALRNRLQSDCFPLLDAFVAAGGTGNDDVAVLARLLSTCGPTSEWAEAFATRLTHVDPAGAEAAFLVRIVQAAALPDLDARIARRFVAGQLDLSIARSLGERLADARNPAASGFTDTMKERTITAAIGRLQGGSWGARRDAIDTLLGLCPESAAARRALREHAAREQDYELRSRLEREADRWRE